LSTPFPFELADLASVLPPGGRTLVAGASGESLLLAEAVAAAGDLLGAMTFTGIFVPGLNRRTYLANPGCRVETFFMTPELKVAANSVDFLPLCYSDILTRLRTIKIDAALMMVAPPDENGLCSFGPCVDFLAEIWPSIPVRIAHINPLMPVTRGHAGIPASAITAFVEGEQPLLGDAEGGSDPVADAIARHIAPFVPNGATLQTGLGKVPGAVLRALTGHRNLRIHSGLIGDAVVDLAAAGALASDPAITAGVAIGSDRLYRAVTGSTYRFQPVSVTHGAGVVAEIPDFIAINSALEVDLFGQAYAELGPKGLMSGPGGASDFARAARIGGGLRIAALGATAAKGEISRIVAPGAGMGPVSLGRMEVDIVVTEHGAADLRELTYAARANALIKVAAPDHRPGLSGAWLAYSSRL
jgi:acyl-CoA hydrolase